MKKFPGEPSMEEKFSETYEAVSKEIEKLREKTGWPPSLLQQLRSIWNILPYSKGREKAEMAASWRLTKINLHTEKIETFKQAIQKELKTVYSKKSKRPVNASIPVEILKTVIELLEDVQDKSELLKEHIVFFELYNQAVNEYWKSKEPRTEKRQASFFKMMGITKTGITGRGKRPNKIDKQRLFWNYLRLTRKGSNRLEPWAALEIIREENGMPSAEATLKEIQLHITELKKALKDEGLNPEVLKNIVPGNPSCQQTRCKKL